MENNFQNKTEAFDHVMKSYNELSNLDNNMSKDYINFIDSFDKERREMFKYIGTIAGATAALSPQIYINVKTINSGYFFVGVLFLIIVLVVSMLYVMASVENNRTEMEKGFREQSEKLRRLKDAAIKFLASSGNEENRLEYGKDLGIINDELQEAQNEKREKLKRIDQKFCKHMDYATEYMLFFLICGITFIILSIINVNIRTVTLIYYGITVFAILNIISALQRKIFVFLGLPVDFIKACFKSLPKSKNKL